MPESDQLDLFDAREAGARAAPVRAAEAPAALERLAAALPETLHLGTSSWSFPGWEGIVWGEPATQRRLARDGLHAYARHPLLKTVCLDRTYYAPLAAAEYADLVAAVPGHFRFVVKAPELLTLARFPLHPRYGERRGQHNPLFLEPDWALDAFLKPLRAGLEVQLGAVVFQLPPQDPGVFGGPGGFVRRLDAFLRALPPGPLYAFEPRNTELLTPDYRDLLGHYAAAHCVSVHPQLPPPALQAARTAVADAPALVVRWNLGGGRRYEDARRRYAPFDRIVDPDPDTRNQLAQLAADAARAGRPAFITVNNKAEGCAPRSVEALAQAVFERLDCGR